MFLTIPSKWNRGPEFVAVGHVALYAPGFGAILDLCISHLNVLYRPDGGAMPINTLMGRLRRLLPTLVLLALAPYAYASPSIHTQALIVDVANANCLPEIYRLNPEQSKCCDGCRETAQLSGSAVISAQRWNQNSRPHSGLAPFDFIVNRIAVANATVIPISTSPPFLPSTAPYFLTGRLRI